MADSSLKANNWKNNPDVNNFLRALTEEQRKDYKEIKGAGAQDRKRQFREMINSQRLTNCTTKQEHTSSTSQSDTTIGTYRNFWVIAEKEGGLMDREWGMRIASNICAACERKGPPAYMWDPVAGCIKYLHAEVGHSDIQTKARNSIMNADVEMDPEHVRLAMQQASSEGLTANVPPSELGQHHGSTATEVRAEPAAKKVKNEPAAGEDNTQAAPSAGDGNILEVMKSMISQNADGAGSANPLVSAFVLQQLMNDNHKAEPKAKAKPMLKVKSATDKLWTECSGLGRKLDGMVTHAASIVEQSKDEDNDWHWASCQVAGLKGQLDVVQAVVSKWSTWVRTSTLDILTKKQGDQTKAWLDDHKAEIESASSLIELPLGILVGMHNTMLKKTAPKAAPKAKP